MKKLSTLLYLLISLLYVDVLYASSPLIKKINSISEFLKKPDEIKKGDILLLDIDGTLILKKISPLKYNLSTHDIQNMNLNFLEKIRANHGNRTYKKFKKISETGPSLTEENLPEILNKLCKEKGVHIFLLTNRHHKRQNATERELSALGYKLDSFGKAPSNIFNVEGDHIFIDGIFYKNVEEAKKTSKGLSLASIISSIKKGNFFSPQSIYFIDEKLKNLEGAEEVLSSKKPGLEVNLLHYTAPPRFDTPEKLETFYRENIAGFSKYENLFKQAFYQ